MPWLTAFLDVPTEQHAAATAFWRAVTGGDVPYLLVRPVRGAARGVHVDVRTGRGAAVAPASWGTHRSVVDQVSIDVPRDTYEAQCTAWSDRLGEPVVPSTTYDEFRFVEGRPLRILLQRLDEPSGPVRAHLDLATDDRDAEVRRHEALGARVLRRAPDWTVLLDPAENPYCVTTRDP